MASFLTLIDMINILDMETAMKVAQPIELQTIEPAALPESCAGSVTEEGEEAIRRLSRGACE